jgi:hypothetical protein
MGLAIETGVLADLLVNDEEGADHLGDSLARVNEVLAEQGLPLHHEPETVPRSRSRAALCGFPYSWLHYLRRVHAHVRQDPRWIATPVDPDADPANDPAVEEEMYNFDSHLLCHSDCEGYYLPIDFTDPVSDDRIVGGFVGSSYRLSEELVAAAPALGIRLSDGHLSDEEAERIAHEVRAETGLFREQAVWLTLYEAARLSIAHKSAICFS